MYFKVLLWKQSILKLSIIFITPIVYVWYLNLNNECFQFWGVFFYFHKKCSYLNLLKNFVQWLIDFFLTSCLVLNNFRLMSTMSSSEKGNLSGHPAYITMEMETQGVSSTCFTFKQNFSVLLRPNLFLHNFLPFSWTRQSFRRRRPRFPPLTSAWLFLEHICECLLTCWRASPNLTNICCHQPTNHQAIAVPFSFFCAVFWSGRWVGSPRLELSHTSAPPDSQWWHQLGDCRECDIRRACRKICSLLLLKKTEQLR